MEEVSINGVRVTGLVNTGAQVTTVKLSWFESNLAGKTSPYKVGIALNAANREPLWGVFNCTMEFGDNSFATITVILKGKVSDSHSDCLLGTNVLILVEIPQYGPRVIRTSKKTNVMRTFSASVVPARSILNIAVSSSVLGSYALLLADPAVTPPVPVPSRLPSLFGLSSRSVRVPVLSNTGEDLVLSARSHPGHSCPGLLTL